MRRVQAAPFLWKSCILANRLRNGREGVRIFRINLTAVLAVTVVAACGVSALAQSPADPASSPTGRRWPTAAAKPDRPVPYSRPWSAYTSRAAWGGHTKPACLHWSPLQPTFLSVSPSTVTPGGCYVVFVENGADVTLDIQYAFNAGSAQTVRGWPKLDSSGRAYVCASPDTAIGDYFFLAIRNAVTADWVPVRATVSVKEPKPVSRIQLARDPLSEVIERALAVHGDGWITGRIVDSVSEGTLTWYTVDGPDPAFNMTLLAKGLRKVQRIVREPSADLQTGTDGTQTWHALSIGFWTIATGQALQFIESQTVRSIQHLFNYQAEGLILRDLGVINEDRVIEAEDRDGRRTGYFIDVMTSRITRLEFVVGQSTDPFSGRSLPNVDTSILSDFRVVQGMLTPFKIERYINNQKYEETRFTSVRYNASVPDDAFRPL